ncbi:hypothetical protein B0H17DRAFT_1195669 [Mycena rosella]|uniref:Uncharacterized protein n=1 Tax=Mycena rosella TaxID=1033263 RepID=A0AAD7GLW4_MYCRO|nr:hypothetical protein B0H17DRAFT_1195669 [Mycena rosella]
MRFKTDFRVSNQVFSELSQLPNYPSFRRAISIEAPLTRTPDVDASNSRFLDPDASSSPQMNSSPSLSTRTASLTPPITSRRSLERIEESEHEEEGPAPAYMRSPNEEIDSPNFPDSSPVILASPSTSPRWTSNHRMVRMDSIEEDELEDDGCPPVSSSPGRSSDSFGADLFPPYESSSSPQTSDHGLDSPDAHKLEFEAAAATHVNDFSSKLHDLLVVASRRRELSIEIDNDLRSLCVTPDYPASSTPPSVDSPLSRAVKRSYSSLHEDSSHSNNSHKKSKPNSRASSFFARSKTSSDNTNLSRVPASLRKSLSLRSDASPSNKSRPAPDGVPTVPNTPCPTNVGRVIAENASHTIPSGVPIIAPPPGHVARLPLTKEACAKIRIVNFLAREGRARAADRLEGNAFGASVNGEEEGARESERLKWEHILGVGAELRLEVVEWILKVLPMKSLYFPPITTASKHVLGSSLKRYSSCASIDSSDGHEDDEVIDLMDQLLTSPETRFHAAYMFARYFYLVMGDGKERKKIKAMQQSLALANNNLPWDPSIPPDGWALVAWDCCLACLAISVKMHRDVLEPLNPVYSWEFEAIAPHKLTYEDLEIAQRDVLSAFTFSLGGTPQQLLDELWTALPSLQQLLSFRGGWNHAQNETWGLLFDAVCEPDVLKFPISLLTVGALVEALLAVLISRYEYDESLSAHAARRRSTKKRADSKKLQQKLMTKAEREIEGVVQDIQAVVGVSDGKLKASRSWLRAA